jgi:hypothetical protein
MADSDYVYLKKLVKSEKAAGGDWEGGRLYQILVLMYIYENKYFFDDLFF